MELFIALFGGGFLLLKLLGEKSTHYNFERKYQAERAAKESDFEKWNRAVVDEDLEERCKIAAMKLLHHSRTGIEEDILSAYDSIPVEIIRLIDSALLLDKGRLLTMAIMANFGKIPRHEATCGRTTMQRAVYDDHKMGKKEYESDWWIQHDIFLLVDRILQKTVSQDSYGPLMCDYHIHSGDPNIKNKVAYSTTPRMDEFDPKELQYVTSLIYYWYPGRYGKTFV